MDSVSTSASSTRPLPCCARSSATGPRRPRRAAGGDRAAAGDRPPARRRRSSSTGSLRRDADGRFCLGLGLVALGRAAAEAFPLAELRPTGARARCATRPARACSCSSARATAGAASSRCSRRTGCAGSCRRARCCRSTVGSAGRVLTGETGRAGWVESVEEREPGVASVSAPVIDADGTWSRRSASAVRSSASAGSPGSGSAPRSRWSATAISARHHAVPAI